MSKIALFTASALLFACSSMPNNEGSQYRDSPGEITIRVGSTEGPMLPGADLFLVGATGVDKLGSTDLVGTATISASRLFSHDSYALLVCKELYFCGAFLLDEFVVTSATGRLIHLAPRAIY